MTAQELEQGIEWTREHLGETIDELAGQAHMKARAAEVSGRIRPSRALRRRWPLTVAAGVLIAGTVIVWRWRKGA